MQKISLALLIFVPAVLSGQTVTTRDCSPVIKDVKGSVTVKIESCKGIPPKALRSLERSLTREFRNTVAIRNLPDGFPFPADATKWENMKDQPTDMIWSTEKDVRLFALSGISSRPEDLADLYKELEKEKSSKKKTIQLDAVDIAA